MNIIVTDGHFPPVAEAIPLTEKEKSGIDHEISHYPTPQAATIEALKIVQQEQGWVSDGKLLAIAEYLHVHPSEVESVATFYNRIYRRPVADNVFLICDSISCWIMGQPELMKLASSQLGVEPGGSTKKITLLPTPCLGACDKAPVMMVNDQLVEKLTKSRLKQLISSIEAGATDLSIEIGVSEEDSK